MAYWRVWKPAFKYASLLCFAIMPISSWSQTCHVVTPTGSGAKDGSNWSNAYAGLPSKLVRGDSYYLADGSYGYYEFNSDPMPWQPNSGVSVGAKVHPWQPNGHIYQATTAGTTGSRQPTWCSTSGCSVTDGGVTWKEVQSSNPAQIYIKKAVPISHCTDTGWNASTMGSGQAVFGGMRFDSDFITIDGQQRSSPDSGYGIKVTMGCASGNCYGIYLGNPYYASSYNTVEYVEIQGHGVSATDTVQDQNVYLAWQNYVTLQYLYIHDSSMDPINLCCGGHDQLLQYSYITENGSTPVNHGGTWQDVAGGYNKTIRYNTVINPTGTAVVAWIPVGGTGTIHDWYIYGNVIYSTGAGSLGDGIFASNSTNQTNNNIYIFNNTIVGFTQGYNAGIVVSSSTNNSVDLYDNLWYNNSVAVGYGGVNNEDYNSFLNGGSGHGAHDVTISSGAPSPFVNASGPTYDFHLTGETSNITGGLNTNSLLSENGTDMDNVTRGADGTWERGAYEYVSGTTGQPPPPVLKVDAVH